MIKSIIVLNTGFGNNSQSTFPRCSHSKCTFSMVEKMLLACDWISHDSCIAELHAYGFNRNAIQVNRDYLSGRSQRTKVESSLSDFLNMIYGFPQWSISGPILSNINFCNLFLSE